MRRAALFALLLVSAPAQAASENAWAEFRADVKKACETALAEHLVSPSITVDPFGSESYGIAVARGVYKGSEGSSPQSLMVCVYDKRTKKAEVSGEFKP